MHSVLVLLLSCAVPGDDSFSGGGTPGEPTGGAGSGGSNGGGDGGDGGGTDDTAAPTGCTVDDLEWSSLVDNNRGSKPYYAGDTFTFWATVYNHCANSVPVELESTCLFDIVSLQPPYGAPELNAAVPGCTTTSQVVELGPSDLETKSYTWGPLYVAGTYQYGLHVTTADELELGGSFTIQ